MLRAHLDDDARLLGGDEAETMLDEDAMRAVLASAALRQLAQHLFRHRQVGAVVDAGDRPSILLTTHHAEKLRLRSLPRLENGLGGLDGIFAEDEDRWHGGYFLKREGYFPPPSSVSKRPQTLPDCESNITTDQSEPSKTTQGLVGL